MLNCYSTFGKKTHMLLFAGLIISVFFCLVNPASSYAAAVVGTVNMREILMRYPEFIQAQQNLNKFKEAQTAEFRPQIEREKNENKRQELVIFLNRRVEVEEHRLMDPVRNKIQQAINTVAKEKKLSSVHNDGTVVYGGVDITSSVLSELRK